MKNSGRDIPLKSLQALFSELNELKAFAQEGALDFDAIALLFRLHSNQRSTVGCLTQSLNCSPSKTSRSLKKLSSLGLIEESTDKEDLRKCYLRLSRKGLNLVQEMSTKFGEARIFEQIEFLMTFKHAGKSALEMHAPPTVDKVGASLSTTSQKILVLLAAAEQSMTVSQLYRAVSERQSTVSMALKTLTARGLIQKAFQKNDPCKRSNQLTQNGDALATAMLVEVQRSSLYAKFSERKPL